MADPTIQDLIRQEAQSAKIDPAIPLGIAEIESSFNPTARNKDSGATGTFQFLPKTAKDRGINAEDPLENIRGGVRYIRDLLDKHSDLDKALGEYGGVKNDTTYIPKVKGAIAKHLQAPQATPSPTGAQAAATPPPGTTSPGQPSATPPPAPSLLESAWGFGKSGSLSTLRRPHRIRFGLSPGSKLPARDQPIERRGHDFPYQLADVRTGAVDDRPEPAHLLVELDHARKLVDHRLRARDIRQRTA